MTTQDQQFHDFSSDMFESTTTIPFHKFKDGEHKFRVAPPFAPKKLYHQVDLHWGFKDQNGGSAPLVCLMYVTGKKQPCPVCDEVERLGAVKTAYEQAQKIGEMKATEKLMSDIRRKSTYLWNITVDDAAKVLQLSWNGHEPLLQKIKFYWEQKKINITAPQASYMMYCSRTGEGARTRYTYEVLDATVKQVAFDKIFDLTTIYKPLSYEQLAKIVKDGQITSKDTKHKEQDFLANLPPAQQAPVIQQAEQKMAAEPDLDMPKAQAAAQPPAGATQAAPPAQQKQAAPQPEAKVVMTKAQEESVEGMLAQLQGLGT